MTELKLCPICGTKATYNVEKFVDRRGYGIICKKTGCLILPAVYLSEKEAASVWNRRVGDGNAY